MRGLYLKTNIEGSHMIPILNEYHLYIFLGGTTSVLVLSVTTFVRDIVGIFESASAEAFLEARNC